MFIKSQGRYRVGVMGGRLLQFLRQKATLDVNPYAQSDGRQLASPRPLPGFEQQRGLCQIHGMPERRAVMINHSLVRARPQVSFQCDFIKAEDGGYVVAPNVTDTDIKPEDKAWTISVRTQLFKEFGTLGKAPGATKPLPGSPRLPLLLALVLVQGKRGGGSDFTAPAALFRRPCDPVQRAEDIFRQH